MSSPDRGRAVETQARELVERLKGRWFGTYGLCFCPAHGDRKSPSLSVQVGNKAVLLKCWAGCDRRDVVAALRTMGPVPGRELKGMTPTYAGVDAAKLPGLIGKLWNQSLPIKGTLADHYLRARGVSGSDAANLRFLPRTKHGPAGVWLPAMIGAIRDDGGNVVALHRTFLNPDKAAKADVEQPRLVLGSPRHGAIELASPATELGLAEGIEKALAAMEMTGCPTWSSWSANQLPQARIPDRITHLRIFADNDRPRRNFPNGPGAFFAEKAVQAHARPGRTITIEPPPPAFHDWDAHKRGLEATLPEIVDQAA